jgi:hypothetical protein
MTGSGPKAQGKSVMRPELTGSLLRTVRVRLHDHQRPNVERSITISNVNKRESRETYIEFMPSMLLGPEGLPL